MNRNGILLLDKPYGLSSNAVLQRVKHLLKIKKVGHTGSLDPLASGMLPICLGEATKFSQFLLNADKTYSVKAKLGIRTTTSDLEGEIVTRREVPHYTLSDIDRAFDAFRGEIQQVPTMFSALKYQGQPLYKLARQGITVERAARTIHIYELKVVDYQNEVVEFELRCSKGTYVRTIVDDFGEHLGCGAHVIALHRLSVGDFQQQPMYTLETIHQAFQQDPHYFFSHYVLPIQAVMQHLPTLSLTEEQTISLRYGRSVQLTNTTIRGMVLLQMENKEFIGIGEVMENGVLQPRRLISNPN